jgi:hypothetical protein
VAFRNHALYVQDDYALNRRLTVNLGLRWEYEAPLTERYNRGAFFDYETGNRYRTNQRYDFQRDVLGAGQLPAGSPAPVLSAPFQGGMGLTSMPGAGRGSTEARYRNFGPRLGVAYKLTDKMVLRSGIGVIYAGYGGNATNVNQLSLQPFFNTRGTALITEDNGRSYRATLSNPFPGNSGLLPGTNDPKVVIERSLGASYQAYAYNHRPSYEISYNFGLQRQVGRWVFEASFIGNRGVHLYFSSHPYVNTLDTKYLSLGRLLDVSVANPFYNAGMPDNGTQLTRSTIPYKQLLSRYPHLVGGVQTLQLPAGNSQYFAGFFRAERRLSNGLSVLLSYTVSKLLEDTGGKAGAGTSLPQDGISFRELRGLSVQDIPQKLVATYLYELPIGKGKRWMGNPHSLGQKMAGAVVGGWKLGGFTMLESGYPLVITQTTRNVTGVGYGLLRPTLAGDYHTTSGVRDAVGFPNQARAPYLNKTAFRVTPLYSFGTVPRILPDMRQPRYSQTDMAIMKEFRFGETKFVQVRLETQNFFNHPVFQLAGADLDIQSATFGYFSGTSSSPRNVQFGARFVF